MMASRSPLTRHLGLAAPLDRASVDTDQIIPKQFLKRIERSGFGPFLFHDWRRTPDGALDPSFVLNLPRYEGASVLLTGENFGCGSSREHAAWALADAGFRIVIAPSFADIFRQNAIGNGVLPVVLPAPAVRVLLARAKAESLYTIAVDLERLEVRDAYGFDATFPLDGASRHRLLEGLDEIDLILSHEDEIARFERGRADTLSAAGPS